MTPQLSFQFTEELTYSSDAFVVHEGVLHITDTLVTLASEQRFAVLFVSGASGVGKTHLGVYCAGALQGLGHPVQILRGNEVAAWMQREIPKKAISQGESVIIDDAHEWLQTKECEGVFTALTDKILHAKGLLVLLSSQITTKLRLTPQVRSRLTSGVELQVGLAEERHLDGIVRAMAKQRGLRIPPAKREFILTRVPRTVAALSKYFDHLKELSRDSRSSTSLDVLTRAAQKWPAANK
jgi:chromosomal replication initiation ATPase DnaA